MRIRSQLIASATLAGLVALLIAVGLLYVTRQAEAGLREQAESQQVGRDLSNMLSLTNEFSVFGGERATAQWRARHSQLLAGVEHAMQRHSSSSPQLEELKLDVQTLPSLFDKLVEIGHEPSTPVAQRRRDLLLERLLTETQEVSESSYRWSAAIGRAQQSERRLFTAMVLAAPAALLLLLISLGVMVGRRVLKPLAHLQTTVTNIRDGVLGARCDTGARDELGDAARAIDSMTATLEQQEKTLVTSNQSLSSEVIARRASEERLRLVTDSMPALVSYLDCDQRFRFTNRAYRDWLDVEPASLIGRRLSELYDADVYAGIQPYIEVALAGNPVTYEREFTTLVGVRRVQVEVTPQRDDEGSVQGLVTTIYDITERKAVEIERAARHSELETSLREKEVLLKEIHHRVKNNLQVVSSLLHLQAGHATSDDARKICEESEGRIKSMALVHEKLYQTKDLANIDFGDYVRDLVAGMLGSYGTLAARVSIHAEAASLLLDVDRAIPAGLVLNELVSNSFKHGFPNDRSGRIDVRLSGGDGLPIQLSVQDDGIGWPQGFDPTRSPSLGLKLVHILAKQLRSSLRFNGENGLHCTLTFDTVPC